MIPHPTRSNFAVHKRMTRETDLARRATEIRKYFRQTITNTNKAIVSQYMQDVEAKMDEYKAEIERLQTAIYALQSKQNRLKATTDLYRPLLSPIYSMPSEILTMIFKFFCEENVLSRDRLPAAIRLSMVCGRWRDIARSTASLWSSISIGFATWTKDFHVLNQLTKRFMRQSKNSPLELTLDFPKPSPGGPELNLDKTRSALDTLIQNCSRWESLTLGMYSTFLPFSILAPIRGHLSSLRFLSLSRLSNAYWQSVADHDPVTIFDDCPSLRYLKTQVPIADRLRLPWTQIIDLELSNLFSDWALQFLSLCPEAEQLKLFNVGDVCDSREGFDDNIVSDKVKSLAILCAQEQCDVDDMLRHVTFSKMTSLVVRGDTARTTKKWQTWDLAHFEAFLARSSCILTTLELKSVPLTDVQALSLLRSLPTIETLEIGEFPCQDENRIITKRFLNGLSSSNLRSDDPFLPRLSNMTLLVHANDVDAEAVLQVLSYRWLPDAAQAVEVGIQCLRFVTMVVLTNEQTPQDSNVLDCLRCFQQAGMNLKITYSSAFEFFPELEEKDD